MLRRPLVVPALIVLAFLALAPAGYAQGGTAPIRLVAPQSGAALVAGSTAEIEWAPLARFGGLPETEEWEAFLSVDGGATYPIRITPHLDSDLRRFRFQVPPIPTANARILLRFGDERRETAVEMPQRFAIAAADAIGIPTLQESLLGARLTFNVGEPALPGQAGVVSWVEGSRRGGGLRQVIAAEQPGLQAPPDLTARPAEDAVLASGPEQAQVALTRNDSAADPSARRPSLLARAGSGPSLPVDILLLTQRQNE